MAVQAFDATFEFVSPDVACAGAGRFPNLKSSVTAEVLQRLLGSERLTSLETVFDAGTTRLAAVVHYLEREYAWSIARKEVAVGCRDGRVAWVAEYWLSEESILQANAKGGASWCAQVHIARAELRKQARKAQENAALYNAKKALRPGHRQLQLFIVL